MAKRFKLQKQILTGKSCLQTTQNNNIFNVLKTKKTIR